MDDELSAMDNQALWALFPIILCAYDSSWESAYEKERELLIRGVGEKNIKRISHIGSTSVPGLIAKPTIDILMEIGLNCGLEALTSAMEQSGYRISPQPDNPPPHLMYLKGYTPRGFVGQCFHVHVRYFGNWPELYFRDYLKEHPDDARAYGELKRSLLILYEHDRDGYTQAKTDFIKGVTQRALELYNGRYAPPNEEMHC